MEKLAPFSLDHCDNPPHQPEQRAYQRNVRGTDTQEYERNPEQEENKALDTVKAKKLTLLIATSAQQVQQRKGSSARPIVCIHVLREAGTAHQSQTKD
jgi:hypothetical protein